MITASAEFKALWHKKQGVPERIRIGYKRRYWDGAAFTNEADFTYLNGWQGDFVGIGAVAQSVDVPFKNVFRTSVVSLRLENRYNQWLETTVPPSIFAIDDTATLGYRTYRTIFQIQYGLKLSGGTWEYLAVFTGLALKPKIKGTNAVATIPVAGFAHKLESSDAEAVIDAVTLENCIPATGDGANKDFESTSIGVDHATDFQVNAASKTKGTGWKTSNANEVVVAGNTGRLAIAADPAPGNLETVKISLKKWKQDNKIDTLLGLLFTAAGIGAGARTISPIIIEGGSAGSKTIDSQAEWEAGTTLTGIDTTTEPGDIFPGFITIDDFTDGDYNADPVWTVTNSAGGTASAASNALVLSAPGVGEWVRANTPLVKSTGTWSKKITSSLAGGGISVVSRIRFMYDGSGNGYGIRFAHFTSVVQFVRISAGVDTVLIANLGSSAGTNVWNMERDGSGNFRIFKNDILVGSVTDNTHTSATITEIYISSGDGALTCTIDDVRHQDGAVVTYVSEEFDLLANPTAWGTLDRIETLGGGTIAYRTNVAAASGGPYDGYVAIGGDDVIQSNLKRYLLIEAKLTPNVGTMQSPKLHQMVANFTSADVFVSLANHAGKNCLQQAEEYLKIPDYELAWGGDGHAYIRKKTTNAEPAIELDQENGIIEITDYDEGIPERVFNVGRVRHGGFVSEYDGASASEASPTSEEEYGRKVLEESITVVLANDVSLADSRSQLIYDNSRRSATDPKPPIRMRLRTWIIPWLELSDVVRISYFDHPIMRRIQANDPLVKPGPYYTMGDPGNILSDAKDWKVISYAPNYDTNVAEMLVEERLT